MVAREPRRGEVWICEVSPQAGRRPVAVVSADPLNDVRGKVIVVVGTTRRRGIPTEVAVGREEGLGAEGVLNGADILTLDKGCLLRTTGRLDREKLSGLGEAMKLTLGLEPAG